MPVVIILNNTSKFDAIRISQDADNKFWIEYAYDVNSNSMNPVYTHLCAFSKFEDVQDYLNILDTILCIDLCKPTTVDIQMDGFPCAHSNIANFLNSIRNGSLCKGIAKSVQFKSK